MNVIKSVDVYKIQDTIMIGLTFSRYIYTKHEQHPLMQSNIEEFLRARQITDEYIVEIKREIIKQKLSDGYQRKTFQISPLTQPHCPYTIT